MWMFVGLGNPGKDYEKNRHNIGFLFLDYLADRYGIRIAEKKWQAELASVMVGRQKILLVKPMTFMNSSGTSVGRIATYYKVPSDHVVVIHDDLDLPAGRLKMVTSRGAGGHNGVRSIITHVGGKNFIRVRIGIGRPQHEGSSKSFVLQNFSAEDYQRIEERFPDIEQALTLLLEDGSLKAMNFLNPQ